MRGTDCFHFAAYQILGVLQVTPSARAESELEASVDKLFDEGGTADQGDSSAGSGQDAETKFLCGAATEGKFPFVLKELLASSILNVEVGVGCGDFLMVSLRFVISSDSSHHSSTHASGAEVDSIIRSDVLPPVMTEAVVTSHAANDPPIPVPEMGTKITSLVHASMFHDSDFTEMIREMEYHHLFTEFNVGTAHQACLNAEVRMRTKYFLSERNRLESECKKQADLLKARDDEVENLKAQLLLKETKAVHALETTCSSLRGPVSEYEQLKEQIEEFQDAQMNIVNDKVAKLDGDLLEMALHLEEKFYPHLLTPISGWRSALPGKSPLADAPGMSDLQPDVEQLTLPIHRPEDQVVLGETSLSFALSVAHSRVEKIRENVAAHRSALIDVWVPLVDPLSGGTLVGTSSTPWQRASFCRDYKALSILLLLLSAGNAASFPTVEFEKEELDTTP
ncbi:hypothetical protein Tco_0990392 [Tanacetum coccineum]|uniref:Uncharacterized protein n=1 Tax=Tanacetum coccineum TaxID=301880 RepID=A0ABQ5EX45_9ASTR